MRGFDRDILKQYSRDLIGCVNWKKLQSKIGDEGINHLLEVLDRLVKCYERDVAEREGIQKEQLPPEEPIVFSRKGSAIKSTDKRKRPIMEEIKKRTGANKVTCVRETATHYVGCPMKKIGKGRGGNYDNLMECWIAKTEMGLE